VQLALSSSVCLGDPLFDLSVDSSFLVFLKLVETFT
jgi:hypothetical protein